MTEGDDPVTSNRDHSQVRFAPLPWYLSTGSSTDEGSEPITGNFSRETQGQRTISKIQNVNLTFLKKRFEQRRRRNGRRAALGG